MVCVLLRMWPFLFSQNKWLALFLIPRYIQTHVLPSLWTEYFSAGGLGCMTCFSQENMDRSKSMLFMSLKRSVWFGLISAASALVVRRTCLVNLVNLEAQHRAALLTYWQWISRPGLPATMRSRSEWAKLLPIQGSEYYILQQKRLSNELR